MALQETRVWVGIDCFVLYRSPETGGIVMRTENHAGNIVRTTIGTNDQIRHLIAALTTMLNR